MFLHCKMCNELNNPQETEEKCAPYGKVSSELFGMSM